MTPAAVVALVRETATDVVRRQGLDVTALPAEVSVTRPRRPAHGDFATNLPLRAARGLGVRPRPLADWLSAALRKAEPVAHAEAAGAGFVNLLLSPAARAELVADALRACGAARPAGLTPPAADPRLLAEYGTDVAHYVRLFSDVDTVDTTRFLRQTERNPVFHLQYGHARLTALLRGAAELGYQVDGWRRGAPEAAPTAADLALLDTVELVLLVADYPGERDRAAANRQPGNLVRHLESLVSASHRFTARHRLLPSGDEPPHRRGAAGLAVCAAARRVLADGLRLLDIAAPERI